MNRITIKIENTDYPIKFGFGANRILAECWGLKTLGQVGLKLSKTFDFDEKKEPTIEQFTALGEFVLSGILNVSPDAAVDADDVADAIMQDVGKMSDIIKLYSDSIPKISGKPKNVKRGQKK